MSDLQQLCDAFILAMRFCASGVGMEYNESVEPLLERWCFTPSTKYAPEYPTDDDEIEYPLGAGQHWIHQVLEGRVSNPSEVVTNLTAYLMLDAVNFRSESDDLSDPAAFATTAYEPLMDALEGIDSKSREYVEEWMNAHFTDFPECDDLLSELHGVEVEFYELWSNSMVRRMVP
jgi:hypothetical protein